MLYTVFMFTAKLAALGIMDYAQAPSVAIDTVAVVLDSDSTLTGDRLKDALLLADWIGHESAGHVHHDGDGGESLGRMQIRRSWLKVFGGTEADLRHPREGIRFGYDLMKSLKTSCGSLRGGLRAYASGTCAGSLKARALVESRCKESGAC